jgi:hypothetical protein
MVNQEQKTIKEAANRLKINYSTAKHIIKSKKSEDPEQPTVQAPSIVTQNFQLPLKTAAPLDI